MTTRHETDAECPNHVCWCPFFVVHCLPGTLLSLKKARPTGSSIGAASMLLRLLDHQHPAASRLDGNRVRELEGGWRLKSRHL